MSSQAPSETLRMHARFGSRFLPHERDILVVLPPGYEAEPARRYPVLYLHDGQNLFEPETAFTRGEHWRAGETAAALIEERRIDPLILVGIGSTGRARIEEYTPTHDRRRGGGRASDYGRLIVEDLKPFIDATYRTLPDAAHTGIGGSSLGGLVSLYLALRHPDVFSKAAALSPSVWWDRRTILRDVRRARPKPPVKIWVDMGTRESAGAGSARRVLEDARLLSAGLVRAGWVDGNDLHFEEVEGGTHGERAWGNRFGRVLEWLFPSR